MTLEDWIKLGVSFGLGGIVLGFFGYYGVVAVKSVWRDIVLHGRDSIVSKLVPKAGEVMDKAITTMNELSMALQRIELGHATGKEMAVRIEDAIWQVHTRVEEMADRGDAKMEAICQVLIIEMRRRYPRPSDPPLSPENSVPPSAPPSSPPSKTPSTTGRHRGQGGPSQPTGQR